MQIKKTNETLQRCKNSEEEKKKSKLGSGRSGHAGEIQDWPEPETGPSMGPDQSKALWTGLDGQVRLCGFLLSPTKIQNQNIPDFTKVGWDISHPRNNAIRKSKEANRKKNSVPFINKLHTEIITSRGQYN